MDYRNPALAVIALSVLTGFLIAAPPGLDVLKSLEKPDQDRGEVHGPTHEHALFFVSVNGTELNFTDEKFQLNSPQVHLENGRSHIVHKHYRGVTWQQFLDTINVSITEKGEKLYCVDIYNESRCGRGEIYVPGGLNSTIEQDEKLIIALGMNASGAITEYREKELPPEYRPPKPGQGV